MKKIIVPATSANLGPGFDILGCCFTLANTFSYEMSDKFKFTGFDSEFTLENNLVYKSYISFFQHLKRDIIPVSIHAECSVPIASGLGSSSTCICAGCYIANEICDSPCSIDEIAEIATQIEGHPDNVVPCLKGGCIASSYQGKLVTISYPIHPSIRFLSLHPGIRLSTTKSREVLPKDITRENSIANTQNVLMLLEGLKNGDEKLIQMGMEDHLHVPYRKKLIPNFDEIQKQILSFGAIGFTISGAGPSCLAIFKDEIKLLEIQNFISEHYPSWSIMQLEINNDGIRCKE